jgi:hypothetical protein
MEQKKFVKFGLTTENFRKYTGIIRTEVRNYISTNVYGGGVRLFVLSYILCSAVLTKRARRNSRLRASTLSPLPPKSPFLPPPPPFKVARFVPLWTSRSLSFTTTSTAASPLLYVGGPTLSHPFLPEIELIRGSLRHAELRVPQPSPSLVPPS